MKRPSDSLFALIKAMGQTEKRYFKLVAAPHAGNRESNKYLKLFDRIDRQNDYDEQEIKSHFRNDPFLGRHLKVAKRHLYMLVLSALDRYHRDEEASVQVMLHQSRILFRKGLYQQGSRLLAKAKKDAAAQEYFSALVEIAEQERNLMANRYVFEKQKVDTLFRDAGIQVKKLQNFLDALETEVRVSMNFEKYLVIRSAKQRRKLELLGKKLLLKKEKPLSGRAAGIFYNSLGSYYLLKNDYEEAEKSYRKALPFCNVNDERNTVKTAILMANCISAAAKAGKFAIVVREAKRLFVICANYPRNNNLRLVQCNLCHTILTMHIESGLFLKGIRFADEVGKRFFADADLRNRVFFNFNQAVLYLGAGNYRKSLQQTSAILNIPEMENPLPHTIYWSRMLQLLSLWEMKEYDTLSYRLKSFYRYLLKRKDLQPAERVLFNFIRAVYSKPVFMFPGNKNARLAMVQAFAGLKKQLFAIRKKHTLPDATEYGYFLSWLESKIRITSPAGIKAGK
ncbi:MAG TPA: tetratricopeptide repeat protein [Bacteroidia bacterium]|jgi:hypothetical protein|nr:tetratricopeptide repeat protein [Bacteroidia bacterium]